MADRLQHREYVVVVRRMAGAAADERSRVQLRTATKSQPSPFISAAASVKYGRFRCSGQGPESGTEAMNVAALHIEAGDISSASVVGARYIE